MDNSNACEEDAANFSFEEEQARSDFTTPVLRVLTEGDVSTFLNSSALKDYLAFVRSLSSKVVGKKVSDVAEDQSDLINSLLGVVKALSTFVDEIPAVAHTMRYGNPAYRDWHQRMCSQSGTMIESILPQHLKGASKELKGYFEDSFGNRTRIDYGTGHETNFCIFLYCLAKLGVMKEEDSLAAVLLVFNSYFTLMRKIQTTYG